jgi:hypothetical protein
MGAATSIAWQIYTWRRNGPHVTVKAAHAITAGPIGDHDLIVITAANDGRAGTMVHPIRIPTSELPGLGRV